ncbi:MAG TPA: HU family DNA-binding protein [Acidimicrobiia bacterium]
MNRSELARTFAERTETTPRQARETIDSLVDLITETVAKGEDVAISGFAKFRRVDRAARMGRNPATGEPVRIKAKRVAKITPLKAFKDAVVSGKAPAKKAVAKKAPARKAPAKKALAQKAPARKAPARKAPAKKAVAKKAPARKAPAKKTAAKRR